MYYYTPRDTSDETSAKYDIGNAKIMKKLFPNFLKILQSTSACIFHKLSLRILNHSDALKISRNLGDKPLCSFLVRI